VKKIIRIWIANTDPERWIHVCQQLANVRWPHDIEQNNVIQSLTESDGKSTFWHGTGRKLPYNLQHNMG